MHRSTRIGSAWNFFPLIGKGALLRRPFESELIDWKAPFSRVVSLGVLLSCIERSSLYRPMLLDAMPLLKLETPYPP